MQKLTRTVLMATLIGWLASCGSRLEDGSPNASGTVTFLSPGTTVQTQVYGDAGSTAPLTEPVNLDAAGKAEVYANTPVDMQIRDASGAMVDTFLAANGLNAKAIEVGNPNFTGIGSTGTQVVGGTTNLDTVLSSLASSLGGTDGLYYESPGATGLKISTALQDIAVSVRSFGAKGDGSADDTGAIQLTINEAKRLKGGTIYFPPGSYQISSALTLVGQDGISWVGAGVSSTTINQTNSLANGITISSCNGFSIRDIFVHGTGTTADGISISGGNNIALERVRVQVFNNLVHFDNCSQTSLDSCPLLALAGAGNHAVLYSTGGVEHTISGGYMIGGSTVVEYNLPGGGNSSIVGTFLVGTVAITAGAGYVVSGCPSGGGSNLQFSTALATSDLAQSGNGVEGSTTGLTSGGAFTPNWLSGSYFRLSGTTTGSAYVIHVPAIVPTRRGVQLRFNLFNNAGGAVTGWSFDAGYHRSATAISLVDTHHTMLVFEYDLDSAVWREVSISDST